MVDAGFIPYTVLRELGEQGVGLCIDIGHLYAEVVGDGMSEETLFSRVMAITAELVPYSRHLHLSTTIPPWNGTDSHNGFLEPDYALGAVPSCNQVVLWLRLFDGHDLGVIPEPYGGVEVHLANHRVLRACIEKGTGIFGRRLADEKYTAIF